MTSTRFQPRPFSACASALVLRLGAGSPSSSTTRLPAAGLGRERVLAARARGTSWSGRARGCAASAPCRCRPCGRSAPCASRAGRRRCPSGDRSSWSSSSTSDLPSVECVPACRLASCQRTTRCRMSARGSSPKIASSSSIDPAGLASSLITSSFISRRSLPRGLRRARLGRLRRPRPRPRSIAACSASCSARCSASASAAAASSAAFTRRLGARPPRPSAARRAGSRCRARPS